MTGRHDPWSRRAAASAVAAALGLLVLVSTGTEATRAGWTTAGLAHPSTSAATGSLAVTHTYSPSTCASQAREAGTLTCPGRLSPTAAATAGGVTATHQTRNDGTLLSASVEAAVGAPSCGPVKLDNLRDATNPMLPRDTTAPLASGPFGGTNAITLDGSLDYASSVVSRIYAGSTLLSAGQRVGWGIWFASTGSGPLFEIASSATDIAGGDSRSLHLNPNGSLTFLANASGSMSTSSSAGWNDGSWHFAYVTLELALVGLATTTRIHVDGTQVGSSTGVLTSMSADSGYWHLGRAPTARTGLSTAYFSGRLSNMVVFPPGSAPAAPSSAQRASQAAFTTWAAAAADHWVLGDSGTTTYAGPYPVIGVVSPCSLVDVTWATTGPASQVGPVPLSTFADGSWRTVAFPGPGVQQSVTLTLKRGAAYSSYVTGLRLYAPLRQRFSAGGSWSTTFTWPDAAGVFLG